MAMLETHDMISIDLLQEDSVCIVTSTYAEINGRDTKINESRVAYPNSPLGRQDIASLGEPYSTAIFAIWGDTPVVQDPPAPVVENEPSEENNESEENSEEEVEDNSNEETENNE